MKPLSFIAVVVAMVFGIYLIDRMYQQALQQQLDDYATECSRLGGKTMFNGKYLECLK